jgi:hypothetical protein
MDINWTALMFSTGVICLCFGMVFWVVTSHGDDGRNELKELRTFSYYLMGAAVALFAISGYLVNIECSSFHWSASLRVYCVSS